MFNVQLEKEDSAKSCPQRCLKTFTRIECRQGMMPDPQMLL